MTENRWNALFKPENLKIDNLSLLIFDGFIIVGGLQYVFLESYNFTVILSFYILFFIAWWLTNRKQSVPFIVICLMCNNIAFVCGCLLDERDLLFPKISFSVIAYFLYLYFNKLSQKYDHRPLRNLFRGGLWGGIDKNSTLMDIAFSLILSVVFLFYMTYFI